MNHNPMPDKIKEYQEAFNESIEIKQRLVRDKKLERLAHLRLLRAKDELRTEEQDLLNDY